MARPLTPGPKPPTSRRKFRGVYSSTSGWLGLIRWSCLVTSASACQFSRHRDKADSVGKSPLLLLLLLVLLPLPLLSSSFSSFSSSNLGFSSLCTSSSTIASPLSSLAKCLHLLVYLIWYPSKRHKMLRLTPGFWRRPWSSGICRKLSALKYGAGSHLYKAQQQ